MCYLKDLVTYYKLVSEMPEDSQLLLVRIFYFFCLLWNFFYWTDTFLAVMAYGPLCLALTVVNFFTSNFFSYISDYKTVFSHLHADLIHLNTDLIHLNADLIHLLADLIHLHADLIHLQADLIHLHV